MDIYLRELYATLGRLATSVYREYSQVPLTEGYVQVRQALLDLHTIIVDAQVKAAAAGKQYLLVPNEQKAWRRRV